LRFYIGEGGIGDNEEDEEEVIIAEGGVGTEG